MQYVLLGQTGMKVSKLCLGTGPFGVAPQENEAVELVHAALDRGINFFDTANSYGNFTRHNRPDLPGAPDAAERKSAQEILGKALKGRRDQAVISTKVREQVGPGINDYGLSRRHMMQQVEASLRALQTDYIDVYHMHGPDFETPIEQTMRTFDDLVRQGKIRYFAFSNFSAWQMVRGIEACRRMGLDLPIVHQIGYNLAMRDVERDVVPALEHYGLSLTAYFPLCAGLLAGPEVRQRPVFGITRFVEDKSQPVPIPPAHMATAEGLEALAAEWGHTPAQVALAWLVSKPTVAAAITGAETIAELDANLPAADLVLDDAQMAALDALNPPMPSWEAMYGPSQPAPLPPRR